MDEGWGPGKIAIVIGALTSFSLFLVYLAFKAFTKFLKQQENLSEQLGPLSDLDED